MEPEVRDNPEKTRFEIRVGETVAGFSTYRRGERSITFIHTEVDPEFGGQGLGTKLVTGALSQVRDQHLEVLPMCPFVRAFIADHAEFLDLVPKNQRERFGL